MLGRKTPLLLSILLFAAGSVAFAQARTMRTLMAGRVLQGIGGGGIDVLVEVIVADMTTLEERSLWLGVMGIPNAVGNILGPVVCGLFTARASWRWLGWLNLPFLGLAWPLLAVYLRLRAVLPDKSGLAKLGHMDWIGMAASSAGILALVLPLSWAGSLYPWSSWRTLLPLTLGLAVIALFLWYEKYPNRPLVPLRLFDSRTACATLGGAFVHGMLLSAILQYIPLVYQSVQLQSVMGAAVSMVPATIVSVVAAVGAMGLVSVAGGGYVWVLRASWVLLAVGTGLLALLDTHSNRSQRQGYPVLWGMGVALLRLLLLPMQASVDNVDDTGLATSLLLFVRFVGSLVGLALASTTFTTQFAHSIRPLLPSLQGPFSPLRNVDQAIAFIARLRGLQDQVDPVVLRDVLAVYSTSFRTVFYVMAAFSVVGLLTSLLTQELTLKRAETGAQGFENKESSS